MPNEIIHTIASISLTLSLIVALVFGISQVRAAARDRIDRFTLETLRNFQTREFAELLLYVLFQQIPANSKEMETLPDKERIMFMQFAQQMESLGILVAERLININLVDKTLGPMVIRTWEKYKPVILDMRRQQPDPYLSEHFQWMAEQIERRMQNHPRKPFHKDPDIDVSGS